MIFNGTAEELADLTRPFWAAEWWPESLRYAPDTYGDWFLARTGTDSVCVDLADAAAIIFAHARLAIAPTMGMWPNADGSYAVGEYDSEKFWEVGRGPSALHAILSVRPEAPSTPA